jgi:hypothetical protein
VRLIFFCRDRLNDGIALLHDDFVPLFEMHPSTTKHPKSQPGVLIHIKAGSSGSGYVSLGAAPRPAK